MEDHDKSAKAPPSGWRIRGLIVIDGLQQVLGLFPVVVHAISQTLALAFPLICVFLSDKLFEAVLDFSLVSKDYLSTRTRIDCCAIFLVLVVIALLLSFSVVWMFQLADAAARKRWGPAYVRRLPEWTRSPFIQAIRSNIVLSPFWQAKMLCGLVGHWLYSLVRDARSSQPTQHVCGVCRNLDGAMPDKLAIKFSELQQSEEGCVVCRVLAIATRRLLLSPDRSSPFFKEWSHYRPQLDIILTWDCFTKRISFRMMPEPVFKTPRWRIQSPSIFFYSLEGEQSLPLLCPPRASSGNPRSVAGLHQVMSWMSDCTSKHDNCSRKEPRLLPDRVLDLGDTPQSPIKLLDTSNQWGYYACLSHRWGSVQPSRTLNRNKKSFEDCIPIHMLPNTFQDAITLCRGLSIRYIWIDSLCIVQDSDEEWQRQSSKMASIFENSFLTIAATKANGHSDGLFATRGADVPEDHVQSISPADIGHGVSHCIFMCTDEMWSLCNAKHWNPERLDVSAGEWPLLTRAWVFQEWLISPRLLHCWKDGILWECKSCILCDCSWTKDRNKDDTMFRNLISHQSMTKVDLTPMELRRRWYNIVERYSEVMGNLTYDSDVFPALSGLATRISGLLGDQYVAGLWRRHLVEGLLWKCESMGEATRASAKRKRQHAPSWSWTASLNQVSYRLGLQSESSISEIYAQVVDVKCIPFGVDLTGRISSAMLTLSGLVSNASLYDSDRIRFEDGSSDGTFHSDFRWFDLHEGRVVCLKLARAGQYDWYMVLRRDSPSSPNFQRLGLFKCRRVRWEWTVPRTWHWRARRRYYEEKRVLAIV